MRRKRVFGFWILLHYNNTNTTPYNHTTNSDRRTKEEINASKQALVRKSSFGFPLAFHPANPAWHFNSPFAFCFI